MDATTTGKAGLFEAPWLHAVAKSEHVLSLLWDFSRVLHERPLGRSLRITNDFHYEKLGLTKVVPTTTRQRKAADIYSRKTTLVRKWQIKQKNCFLLWILKFSATLSPDLLRMICIYFILCSTTWLKKMFNDVEEVKTCPLKNNVIPVCRNLICVRKAVLNQMVCKSSINVILSVKCVFILFDVVSHT